MFIYQRNPAKNRINRLWLILLPFIILGYLLTSCNLVDSEDDAQEKLLINGIFHYQKDGVWYATFKGVDYQVDPDIITVKLKASVSEHKLTQLNEQVGIRILRKTREFIDLKLSTSLDPVRTAEQYLQSGLFETVHLNYIGLYSTPSKGF